MSVPSSLIEPVNVAPTVISWRRFMDLNKVVFPEPDGPIIDVTIFSSTAKLTFLTAGLALKRTVTSSIDITGAVVLDGTWLMST
jgi:hypothetical protein